MPFNQRQISRRKTLGLLGASALSGALIGATTLRVAAANSPAYDSSLPPISHGINIPLWMDQPDGDASVPSDAVLTLLYRFGFASVRLPIDPDRFAVGGAETLKAQNDLRQAIDKLLWVGFNVTLDMHPQGEIARALKVDSSANASLITAWKNIASVAKEFPHQLVYLELLNEPQMWRDRWLPLRDQLAAILRFTCPRHTIIWGANKYQSIAETVTCPPLADKNSIVAVHYYAPLAFTHQCKPWGAPQDPALTNLPFPANLNSPEIAKALSQLDQTEATKLTDQINAGWNVQRIDDDFAKLADWANATDTKVILNEFATLKFCADPLSRARWTRAVRRAAERHNIGWTYWEFDRGFGFMDSRLSLANIDLELVAALVGEAS